MIVKKICEVDLPMSQGQADANFTTLPLQITRMCKYHCYITSTIGAERAKGQLHKTLNHNDNP